MYPRLEINVNKLKENTKALCDMCHENNIDVAMVTKAYCAINEVVKEVVTEGVDYIADSRIDNLKNVSNINIPKILLRIPMINELEDVVNYSDISFNSEIKTILNLNEIAKASNKVHKVVIMVDLGDLREGYFNESELYEAIEKVIKLENIKLIGLATNLTCYGAIIPSEQNLGRLVEISKEVKEKFNTNLEFISGGNSSSLYLLENNTMPKGITNLRLGEAILLGKETAYGKDIKGTHNDAFKLVCKIVEIKEKPSIPIGEIGVDAFGNKPEYKDNGIRKRAILAIGKQDVDITSISPINEKINILGASSDHMILDITNSDIDYDIGDKIEFSLSYGGLMSASTSKYVYKKIIHETANSFN